MEIIQSTDRNLETAPALDACDTTRLLSDSNDAVRSAAAAFLDSSTTPPIRSNDLPDSELASSDAAPTSGKTSPDFSPPLPTGSGTATAPSSLTPTVNVPAPEPTEVLRTATLVRALHGDGATELRVFGPDGKIFAGLFRDPEKLADYAVRASRKGLSCYFSLNPVSLDVKLPKEAVEHVKLASKDADVLRRCLLFIDVDSQRDKGLNASEAEKAAAWAIIRAVLDDMQAHGFSAPIVADSGNGFHLLYRIDLPNDQESQRLHQGLLKQLSAKFSTEKAKVDKAVHNPARISRLYGTVNVKAPGSPGRPQRTSCLLEVPEAFEATPREVIEAYLSIITLENPVHPTASGRTSSQRDSPKSSVELGPRTFSDPAWPASYTWSWLVRIPPHPSYETWIQIISATLDATAGNVDDAAALLCRWSPEEKPGEYRDKLSSPLASFDRYYLLREAGVHRKPAPPMVKAGAVPQSVFDRLPEPLRRLSSFLRPGHERDVALLSEIASLAPALFRAQVHTSKGREDLTLFVEVISKDFVVG